MSVHSPGNRQLLRTQKECCWYSKKLRSTGLARMSLTWGKSLAFLYPLIRSSSKAVDSPVQRSNQSRSTLSDFTSIILKGGSSQTANAALWEHFLPSSCNTRMDTDSRYINHLLFVWVSLEITINKYIVCPLSCAYEKRALIYLRFRSLMLCCLV